MDRTMATVQVTVGNPAVVQGPVDDSCPSGAAVAALAVGASTVRVRVTDQQGQSVEGATLARVQSGVFNVSGVASRVLLTGSQRLLLLAGYGGFQADGYLFTYSVETTPSTQHAFMVPGWLRPTSSQPAVATLEPVPGVPGFRMNGLTVGSTRVGAVYEPPNLTPLQIPEGDVQVVDTFTVNGVSLLQLEQGGRTWMDLDSRPVPPGCYELWAHVNVEAGGSQESVRLSGGLDWSVVGGVGQVTPGNVAQYCATGNGDAILRACKTGVCRTGAWPVFPEGEIVSVALIPSSVTVSLPSITRVCLDLRAEATLRSGETRDITASAAARWSTVGQGQTLNREMGADGLPVQDGMGRPCFFPTSLDTTFSLNVRYGYAETTGTVVVNRQP